VRNKRGTGSRALGLAVMEEAVHDLRALKQAGVIGRDGTIDVGRLGKWGVCGYKTEEKVSALLEWFFGGGANEWFGLLGMRIDEDDVLSRVGIEKGVR
jgi:hypothetical protein